MIRTKRMGSLSVEAIQYITFTYTHTVHNHVVHAALICQGLTIWFIFTTLIYGNLPPVDSSCSKYSHELCQYFLISAHEVANAKAARKANDRH